MSEAEVIFSLKGVQTKIKCNKEDLMKDILEKYKAKDNVDISSMYLLYKGNKINPFITFKEQLAEEDKKKNVMDISCIQMSRRNTVRKSSKRKKEPLNSSFRKSNYQRSITKRININDFPKTLKTEKSKELTTESKKPNYIKKKSLFKQEPKEPVKNEALYDNGFNFNKMFNYNDFFRAYSCQINLTDNNEKTPVIKEYISNEVIQRNTEAVNNNKMYEDGNKNYPSSEKKLEKEFDEFQIKYIFSVTRGLTIYPMIKPPFCLIYR